MTIQRAARLTAVSLALSTLMGGPWINAQEASRTAAVTSKPTKIPAPKKFTRQVAPGVEFLQEALEEGHPEGPLTVSVVRINPKREGVKIEAALGQDRVWGTDSTLGRETVSSLVARHKAVVGINAAFFPYAGNPIGLHIQDGELVTEPSRKRTCFILTKKGEMRLVAFDYSAAVETEDGQEWFRLDGLNRRPAGPDRSGKIRDELLVFTPIFMDNTLRSPKRVEVVLTGIKGPVTVGKKFQGTVEAVTEGGGTPLAQDTVVLSGSGAAGEFLKKAATPGAKLSFRFDLQTVDGKTYAEGDEIAHATAGGPRLVTDGKVDVRMADEGFASSFANTRHPRTAFGVTKDKKLLLVAVDGRQKGVSRGVSLTELAEIMRRYGAVDAVNMDGGGSTACVIRNQVINAPADGSQNVVASMLLVYAPDAEAKPENPENSSQETPLPEITLKVGETKTLTTDPDNLLWGLKPGGIVAGFVRQDGVFYALRPGHSTILATPTKKAGKPQTYRVVVRLPNPPPTPAPLGPTPGITPAKP